MELLKGKVILVTGGAGLLGKEFIRAITKEGGVLPPRWVGHTPKVEVQ